MRPRRYGLLLAMATLASAQTVIRTESRMVLVDAVVTEKGGRPVRDLRAGDFRIWEDGKEQKISSVSLETAARSPDKGRRSYVLLFFDGSSISPGSMAQLRQTASRFVDEYVSPDRYMAVAHFTNAVRVSRDFTVDADSLKRALAVVPATGAGPDIPFSAIRPTGLGSPEVAPGSFNGFLPGFRAVVESLGAIRGRKAVVLFGGAVSRFVATDSEVAATVRACNKANVVVYVMETGATLHPLAQRTGGRSIRAGEMGKVGGEQEEYYLLAYVPPEAPEGSCHDLRVKVDRAGAEVRARGQYCTVQPPDVLAGKPAGKAIEERAAGPSPPTLTATMQLPYFYRAASLARVIVAMEIGLNGVNYQKVKGRPHVELNLVGIAQRHDGSVSARFSDTVNLAFDSEREAAATIARPFHYENQLDLGPGSYIFRMAFTAGDKFGKVEIPLVLEPWDGKSLTLSGIAIAAATRQVPNLAAALDDALLEDRRPLLAGSIETVPSGNNRCSRAAPCQAYLELYEPLLTGPNPPSPALRVRLLDRATGEPKLDSGPFSVAPYVRQGSHVVPVPLTLPVAGLPVGSYVMEIRSGAAVRTANLDLN